MKLISTIFITALSSISVAEAKKSRTSNNSRKPASAVLPYCGVLAISTAGSARMKTYTIVDELTGGKSRSFNVAITPDSPEMSYSDAYAPRPGDSEPGGPSFVDHNVRIAGENVHMGYSGHFTLDSQVAQGKCICVTGEKDPSSNNLVLFEGYAIRPDSKCAGVSQEAVARFTGHRD